MALWVTDRKEHELICLTSPHECFACSVDRSNCHLYERCVYPHAMPRDSTVIREQTMRAMTTGRYGDNDEWKHMYAGHDALQCTAMQPCIDCNAAMH